MRIQQSSVRSVDRRSTASGKEGRQGRRPLRETVIPFLLALASVLFHPPKGAAQGSGPLTGPFGDMGIAFLGMEDESIASVPSKQDAVDAASRKTDAATGHPFPSIDAISMLLAAGAALDLRRRKKNIRHVQWN